MSPDVTITISTAGGGASDTRGPVPSLEADATAANLADSVGGPVPLPLDELPDASAGTRGTNAGGAAGSAPLPMDLDRLTTSTAGLPQPEDLDAMAAASKAQESTGKRTRRTTSR
jgi:hypothetical protein